MIAYDAIILQLLVQGQLSHLYCAPILSNERNIVKMYLDEILLPPRCHLPRLRV
jgi:hypothetical protein